jgi:hypothetical protein
MEVIVSKAVIFVVIVQQYHRIATFDQYFFFQNFINHQPSFSSFCWLFVVKIKNKSFMKLRASLGSSSKRLTRLGGKQPRKGSVSSASSTSSSNTAQRFRRMQLQLPPAALDEKIDAVKISSRRRRAEDPSTIATFHRLLYDQDSESDNSPPATWLLVELAQKIGVKALVPLFVLATFMLRLSQPVVPRQEFTPHYLRVRAYRVLANETGWLNEVEELNQIGPNQQINASAGILQGHENGTAQIESVDEKENKFLYGTNESQTGETDWLTPDGNQREDTITGSLSTHNLQASSRFNRDGSLNSMQKLANKTSGYGINESSEQTLQGPRGKDSAMQGNASSSTFDVQSNSQPAEDGGDGTISVPSGEMNEYGDNPTGSAYATAQTKLHQKLSPGAKGKVTANIDRHGVQDNSVFNQSFTGFGDSSPLHSAKMTEIGDQIPGESGYATTEYLQQTELIQRPPAGGNLPQNVPGQGKLVRQTNPQFQGVGVDASQFNGDSISTTQIDESSAGGGAFFGAWKQNEDNPLKTDYQSETAESLSDTAPGQKMTSAGKAARVDKRGLQSGQQFLGKVGDGDEVGSRPMQNVAATNGGGKLRGPEFETENGSVPQGNSRMSNFDVGNGGSAELQQYEDNPQMSESVEAKSSKESVQRKQPPGGREEKSNFGTRHAQANSHEADGNSLATASVGLNKKADGLRGSGAAATKAAAQNGDGQKKLGGKRQRSAES